VQTAESAKLAQVWACNYEDAIIASVIGGPSPDLFSQVGYDTVEVAGLSYQAATNSTTPANSTSKKLYKDAQAQETFASSMTNVNWSEPATFLSGSAPNAVMKDCDAIANSKS
ncbi:MAG: hypothetical protein M1368_07165, partial [Thaumarchaeota archaeon]|nr:hypothetical protein [Nitrososphaerota archaeon]